MSDLVILVDMACSPTVCGPMLSELWPGDAPKLVSLPVSGLSAAHEAFVADYRASHGGAFLEPFLREHDALRPNIALVGFSAGCWGVRSILADPEEAAMAGCVLVVDGLHGSYSAGKVTVHPAWLAYADRAAAGSSVLAVSYSAIVPGAYPGTRETAHALADRYGIALAPGDLAGLACQELGQRGNLALVGAWPPGTDGNDKAAHIYQANTVQDALWRAYLAPWSKDVLPVPPPAMPPGAAPSSSAGPLIALTLAAAGIIAAVVVSKHRR